MYATNDKNDIKIHIIINNKTIIFLIIAKFAMQHCNEKGCRMLFSNATLPFLIRYH